MLQLNGMRASKPSEEAISKFVASCDVNQTTFSSDLWNAIYFESYFFVVALLSMELQRQRRALTGGKSCGGIYYLSNHENMRLQWKEEAVKVKERFQRCDKEWKDAFNMFIVSASSPYRLCCCCASLWHSWLFFCAACAFAPAQFKTINYDKSLALFIEKKRWEASERRKFSAI